MRKVNVVAIVPSVSSRYDSTALCAPSSSQVGMLAITYQSPMKRGISTWATVARGGKDAPQAPISIVMPIPDKKV
ncbi:MAG: hypothetical protein WBF16_01050 [Candidatus Deferrimicrobiaceae bacterium]